MSGRGFEKYSLGTILMLSMLVIVAGVAAAQLATPAIWGWAGKVGTPPPASLSIGHFKDYACTLPWAQEEFYGSTQTEFFDGNYIITYVKNTGDAAILLDITIWTYVNGTGPDGDGISLTHNADGKPIDIGEVLPVTWTLHIVDEEPGTTFEFYVTIDAHAVP